MVAQMLRRMDAEGAEDLTYAEFCAHRLELQFARVELYLYDLSRSMAHVLSPVLLGRHENGVWHSSVVVHGTEFYYYGTLRLADPGTTEFGEPTEVVDLGVTLRSSAEVDEMLDKLDAEFQPEKYDVFRHNCNDLSDKLVLYLLGRHIPDSVRLLTERLAKSSLVRVLAPLLNRVLGARHESNAKASLTHAPSLVDALQAAEAEAPALISESQQLGAGDLALGPQLLRHPSSEALAKELEVYRIYEAGESEGEDGALQELVYSEVPGLARRVVAQVTKQNTARGTSDLKWFNKGGCFHIAASIRTRDLAPYRAACALESAVGDDDLRRQWKIFAEARLGASRSRANGGEDTADPNEADPEVVVRRSLSDASLDPRKRPSEASWESYFSVAVLGKACPNGHVMEAGPTSRRSLCCASAGQEECFACVMPLKRGDRRVGCAACRHYFCERCWHNSCNEIDGRSPLDRSSPASSRARLRCPAGHALERMEGQAVRGTCACSECGRRSLGSTCAFFHSLPRLLLRPVRHVLAAAQGLLWQGQPWPPQPRLRRANGGLVAARWRRIAGAAAARGARRCPSPGAPAAVEAHAKEHPACLQGARPGQPPAAAAASARSPGGNLSCWALLLAVLRCFSSPHRSPRCRFDSLGGCPKDSSRSRLLPHRCRVVALCGRSPPARPTGHPSWPLAPPTHHGTRSPAPRSLGFPCPTGPGSQARAARPTLAGRAWQSVASQLALANDRSASRSHPLAARVASGCMRLPFCHLGACGDWPLGHGVSDARRSRSQC
ncbi:unnamed protein product [Prorocentrum cordatum]|uniref:PPPDE domain-containing protein n=1 Tax=Prorocentrum cordatum TaxID=2364126 RepID=A0ABN9YGE7_9DINO|nr:unnamed protein product [Polarella glacialis]